MVSTNLLRFLSALAALAVPTATVVAADSTKIDRRIAKEPVYQSKAPKYCLLVFGPEAKTRVWLVLDADKLYLDRNANGDLTEANERVKRAGKELEAGDVTDSDGKAKYARLRLKQFDPPENPLWVVSLDVRAKYRQFGCVRFAGRPQDAPVLWFDGPLTMGFSEPEKQALERGEKGSQINAWIGTLSPANQRLETVYLEHSQGVPADIHPTAFVEFPNRDPKGKPITITVTLNERC
jgi:hypothetical protein